jgi:hypothetical protein
MEFAKLPTDPTDAGIHELTAAVPGGAIRKCMQRQMWIEVVLLIGVGMKYRPNPAKRLLR